MDALKTVQMLVDALEKTISRSNWPPEPENFEALYAGRALIAQMQRDATDRCESCDGSLFPCRKPGKHCVHLPSQMQRDAVQPEPQQLTDGYDFWKPIRDLG